MDCIESAVQLGRGMRTWCTDDRLRRMPAEEDERLAALRSAPISSCSISRGLRGERDRKGQPA